LQPKVKTAGNAEERALARSAGTVSAFTLVSRVLGLAREQVFAALLGAGLYADAFQIAFRIPNLLRDLFAEGALSAALVPTYAKTIREGGAEAAYRLANRLFTLLGILLSLLVLVAVLFSEPIVRALALGFDSVPGKTEITVKLTRIMLPFLPMVSFAAVAMGMLNAESRFRMPAVAPALFNVVAIVGGMGFWALGFSPEKVAVGWAVATLLGGAAQFLVQVPPLWRSGFRFRWDWAPEDPGLRRMARLMGPATIGLAAVQLNIFLSSHFASYEPRAVSWLQYAFRILYLPIGLFGAAVGTVAATGFAHRAASGDTKGLQEGVRRALRTLGFLTIPSTVGLVVLASPIVALLYERGAFTAVDTQATARALSYYSLGLVAYTGVKVLAPAFYALGAARVPLVASALAVAANIVVILVSYESLRFRGVALGLAIGSVVNMLALGVLFERRIGGLRGHGLAASLGRMLLASVPMALVAWSASRAIEARMGTGGGLAHATAALVPVILGSLAYFLAARALRLPELDAFLSIFRKDHSSVRGNNV
jgi:putative peptidoglycan lipid II flippase